VGGEGEREIQTMCVSERCRIFEREKERKKERRKERAKQRKGRRGGKGGEREVGSE